MTNKKEKNDTLKNLGTNIRNLRLSRGLSIEAFAESIDVSSRIIYDYENDLKRPSLITIAKIVEMYQISYDTILC